MNEQEISKQIESLLFYAGEPVELSELRDVLEVSDEEIVVGIETLEKSLVESSRGVRLVRHSAGKSDTVMLATAPECSEIVEKMIRTERESTLGRASLETLSIVAYRGTVSKKEIEYIRGVNSDYAVRALLLRGLIEKNDDSLYTVTSDTLLHLGISKISDLPEYDAVKKELEVSEVVGETEEQDGQ